MQVLGAMARELTRQVLDIKGALPAAMFADSPHLSEEDLAELERLENEPAAVLDEELKWE